MSDAQLEVLSPVWQEAGGRTQDAGGILAQVRVSIKVAVSSRVRRRMPAPCFCSTAIQPPCTARLSPEHTPELEPSGER